MYVYYMSLHIYNVSLFMHIFVDSIIYLPLLRALMKQHVKVQNKIGTYLFEQCKLKMALYHPWKNDIIQTVHPVE